MGEQTEEKKPTKRICAGLLAHVDAGKTTLSEGLLYVSGSIRSLGRVDNKNAFLDTFELERARGITIFSKQARLNWGDCEITLLDTPGHVDFSAEMERTLQVLDAAVLVISGADGVQGHTRTLWYLLRRYRVPVFIFVNKMDQPGTDRQRLMEELKQVLDASCVDFSGGRDEAFYEETAMCGEEALEQFLEEGRVDNGLLCEMIQERKLFPCFFGSALKLGGVKELLDGLCELSGGFQGRKNFGARVFKIARDSQGNRLTYMKITGGSLQVRTMLSGTLPGGEEWEEKVNQIRLYSGEKYELTAEAGAGSICAVTGLNRTFPGEGLGTEKETVAALLTPVLTYQLILPPECEVAVFLPRLRQLEEEDPQLHVVWNESLQEIHVQVMGEVQIEILRSLIRERFGTDVEFGTGNIVYKETIVNRVEGVGHFEPLRHYAEVHLMLEPGPAGSGLQFASVCSTDVLEKNWQRLVLTHLEEKEHRGVLTGSPITDMKITLLTGRAHLKHTEGGDFRQATYRAVRQGLMQADCVLLEPWYDFSLEIPEKTVGRAMTDIEKMHGSFQPPVTVGDHVVLTGTAPVATMRDYQREVTVYTRGSGRLFCTLRGYEPCHNAAQVMEQSGYDPLRDVENTPDSVFCAHGAGFVVSWDRVFDYMHLEGMNPEKGRDVSSEAAGAGGLMDEGEYVGGAERLEKGQVYSRRKSAGSTGAEAWLGTEEIDEILERAHNANRRDKSAPRKDGWNRRYSAPSPGRSDSSMTTREWKPKETVKKDRYLLVDGYNVIFAWEDLNELAAVNVDAARGKLQDILCNYQAFGDFQVIVVFDAYRVQGHQTEILNYHNIHVVFTKEAETADQYIEKFTHENGKKYDITVATSDGLEQIIIRGQGCRLLSSRELREEIEAAGERIRDHYLENQKTHRRFLLDEVSGEVKEQLDRLRDGREEEKR